MDAVGAFSYLADNIPEWIDRLSDLAVHTAAKHAEYSAAFKKLSAGRRPRPRRRKNSSVCSIHTEDQEVVLAVRQEAQAQQQQQQQQQQQPNHSKDSAIDDSASQNGPYENPRKRGPDEAPSVSDDEPDFVCTRHNVVIEYDGHTQRALEDIARKIAISRNNLRRGKMASMIRPGLRMALRNNKPLDGASDADSPDVLLSSIRSTRNRTSQNTMCFDMAEKQLELLNSHCEAAAHEVLRVGQCATQLEAMKEKFTALRGMARTEVDRLKKQQAQLEAENPVKPSSPQPVKSAAEVNKNPMSNTNAIEVDDDTGESEEVIDMSVFRTARRMRM